MSGIYIKGMEMPQKKYGYVLVIYPDGKVHCQDGEEYQAVPVPKHGRLIDADALLDSDGDVWDGMWGHSGVQIANAPTIIPASPAEEGET